MKKLFTLLISVAILAGISYGFVFSGNTGNNNSVSFSNPNFGPNVLNSQSPDAVGTWTNLGNSGVTSILRSVSIVDNNVAFISGDAGVILKTTNGGNNWTNMYSAPLSNTIGCDVVRAIDANTVFTAQNGTSAILYKSTNGGLSWTQVHSEVGGYFDDFRFKDANNGFLYGDPVGGRWSLWKTANGGTTWDSTGLYLPQVSGEAGWDNAMPRQGNNLWFGTSSTHIYLSTNFGANWTSSTTTGLTQSTSITFSGNIGFVTGGGVSLKSLDGGLTWSPFTNPTAGADIHFQSLGSRFWIAQTNIYYSTDNGTTFPLSYTYPGTSGPMWGIESNLTGTQLTVFVSGYSGGIWRYTETVAPAALTLNFKAIMQGFYNGTTMIPDTVHIALRNSTAPYALVETKSVLLNSSGVGNPSFTTAVNGTPYFIVVKHRNSIETWSATTETFSGSTLSYDFTTAAGQAYGSNQILVGTKWCIFSGDANQDGSVDALDMIAIDNDVANFITGYVPTDVNGDGSVDALDMIICDNNSANFVAAVKPPGALNIMKIPKTYEQIKAIEKYMKNRVEQKQINDKIQKDNSTKPVKKSNN